MLRMVDTTALHAAVRFLGLPLAYRMKTNDLVEIVLGELGFGPGPECSSALNRFAAASDVTPAVVLLRHLEAVFGAGRVLPDRHQPGQGDGPAQAAIVDLRTAGSMLEAHHD